MPQIKDYQTRALDIRPSETGINATAAAARRVGAEYNEAGSSIAAGGAALGQAAKIAGDVYVDYQDHKEKSAGAVHGASLFSELDDDWNKTFSGVKDPNTPGTDKQWMDQKLEPSIQDFKQGFTTRNSQDWAESYTDRLREHFNKKTSADMASRAADAAEVNLRQTTNMLSNAVRSDPTSLDFAIGNYKDAIDGIVSTPRLKGTVGEKIRTQLLEAGTESIVKNAAMGAIEKTGKIPDWVTDPKYSKYIKGDELKQFQQASNYYNRLNKSQANSEREASKREAVDKFNRSLNDLELSTRDDTGKIVVGPQHYQRLRQIGRENEDGASFYPGRLQAAYENLDRLTARMNKPEPMGPQSRETFIRLSRKIAGVDGERMADNKEIYDNAYQLTVPHLNRLLSDFASAKTPDGLSLAKEREQFMKRMEGFIDPNAALGLKSEAGQARMEMFIQDARRREDEARKAGKDPHEVYNPKSPFYVGSQENINKYRTSLQDNVRARAGQLPSLPEEQPASFKERLDDAYSSKTTSTIPQPDKREVGKTYQTPKGPLKWTGKDWVK